MSTDRPALRIVQVDGNTETQIGSTALEFRSILEQLRRDGATGELCLINVASGDVVIRVSICGASGDTR